MQMKFAHNSEIPLLSTNILFNLLTYKYFFRLGLNILVSTYRWKYLQIFTNGSNSVIKVSNLLVRYLSPSLPPLSIILPECSWPRLVLFLFFDHPIPFRFLSFPDDECLDNLSISVPPFFFARGGREIFQEVARR